MDITGVPHRSGCRESLSQRCDDRMNQPGDRSAVPGVVMLVNSLSVGGAERQTIALANMLSGRFRVALAHLKPSQGLQATAPVERLAELRSLNVRSRIDLSAAR